MPKPLGRRLFGGQDDHYIVHLNDERETVLGHVRLIDGHWRAQPDRLNEPTDVQYGSKEEAADSFPLPTITVSLHIENHYELHGQIDTDVNDVQIEAPPITPEHKCPAESFDGPRAHTPTCEICDTASDEYSVWADQEINQHTGTGREDGDAAYFVTVTASSNESVLAVGTEFEFGT